MSWVDSRVSLEKIVNELKNRAGSPLPWDKRDPRGCPCKDCERERAEVYRQAYQRNVELNCPNRANQYADWKEKEDAKKQKEVGDAYDAMQFLTRGFSHNQGYDYLRARRDPTYGTDFADSATPKDIWKELTREADKIIPKFAVGQIKRISRRTNAYKITKTLERKIDKSFAKRKV